MQQLIGIYHWRLLEAEAINLHTHVTATCWQYKSRKFRDSSL